MAYYLWRWIFKLWKITYCLKKQNKWLFWFICKKILLPCLSLTDAPISSKGSVFGRRVEGRKIGWLNHPITSTQKLNTLDLYQAFLNCRTELVWWLAPVYMNWYLVGKADLVVLIKKFHEKNWWIIK